MGMELHRRPVNYLYLLFILLDLFFIAVLLLDIRSEPLQFDSTMQFIKAKLDLKQESNLATWYSSIILFITGVFAFLNLRVNPFTAWKKWIYLAGWALIGGLLMILSADESAQIHESIATLAFHASPLETRGQIAIGAGDWLPFLMPFIVISALGLLSFIVFSFFGRKKIMPIALLGVLCWIGAIVAESTEGRAISPVMTLALEGMIEESLEVIGTTLLMIAFSEHYQWRQQNNSTLSDVASFGGNLSP